MCIVVLHQFMQLQMIYVDATAVLTAAEEYQNIQTSKYDLTAVPGTVFYGGLGPNTRGQGAKSPSCHTPDNDTNKHPNLTEMLHYSSWPPGMILQQLMCGSTSTRSLPLRV